MAFAISTRRHESTRRVDSAQHEKVLSTQLENFMPHSFSMCSTNVVTCSIAQQFQSPRIRRCFTFQHHKLHSLLKKGATVYRRTICMCAHLAVLGLWASRCYKPQSLLTHGQCEVRLPSQLSSIIALPLWYQMTLLIGDRGRCALAACCTRQRSGWESNPPPLHHRSDVQALDYQVTQSCSNWKLTLACSRRESTTSLSTRDGFVGSCGKERLLSLDMDFPGFCLANSASVWNTLTRANNKSAKETSQVQLFSYWKYISKQCIWCEQKRKI